MDSQNWYLINPQPTMNSGFEKEEWDNWVGDSFDEDLTETQLGETVIFCKGQFNGETDLFETEFETQAVVQNKTVDAYTQGWKRQLLTRISDMVADYKYIKIKDTKDNWQIYVIMAMPDSNGIYTKVVVHECNYTLKWQDKKDGTIYYYPCCVENASQYNTGETSVNSVVKYGYSQLMCWLSLDDISIGVKRNYRFFVDYNTDEPLVYRTTSMDRVTYSYNENRILRLVMTEDLYNPDVDSLENWLCDYIDTDDVPQPIVPIVISYKGNPEIKIGGRKTFYVNSKSNITFSLIVSEMWQNDISLEQGNNQCVIRCENKTAMIGANIKLTASDGTQTAEILIAIKGAI